MGLEKEKFLGDKAIADGKGLTVGRAVMEILGEWGLKPRETDGEKRPTVGVLSFDTTASNTSRDVGELLHGLS